MQWTYRLRSSKEISKISQIFSNDFRLCSSFFPMSYVTGGMLRFSAKSFCELARRNDISQAFPRVSGIFRYSNALFVGSKTVGVVHVELTQTSQATMVCKRMAHSKQRKTAFRLQRLKIPR